MIAAQAKAEAWNAWGNFMWTCQGNVTMGQLVLTLCYTPVMPLMQKNCLIVNLCAAVAVTRMLLTCSSQKKWHSHLLEASHLPCILLPGSLMLIYLGRVQVTTHSCTNVPSNSLKNSIIFVGDSSWCGVNQPSGEGYLQNRRVLASNTFVLAGSHSTGGHK